MKLFNFFIFSFFLRGRRRLFMDKVETNCGQSYQCCKNFPLYKYSALGIFCGLYNTIDFWFLKRV